LIVSGGGGWGAKQGLLSLDPQTTYTQNNDIPLEFTGTSLEEQQASALGNIAQPGSYIRFFTRSSWSSWTNEETTKRVKFFDPTARTVVVGTSPSTIDDIPGEAAHGEEEFIRLRSGYFGCVSQSGVFIDKKLTDAEPTHRTKLDMPNSFLFTCMESAYMDPSRHKNAELRCSNSDKERYKLASLLIPNDDSV
jgi:hypothetical protein